MTTDTLDTLIVSILADLERPLYTTTLVKLIYLIDLIHYRHEGRTATGLTYIWDEYGPNAEGHLIVKRASAMEQAGRMSITSVAGRDRACVHRALEQPSRRFEPVLETIVRDVLGKYGKLSFTDLVAATKATEPFLNARPGDRLIMKRQERPIPVITEDDWQRHLAERERGPGKSVAELRAKYGLD